MKNFKSSIILAFILFIISSLNTTAKAQCQSHQTLIDNLTLALNQQDTSQLSGIYQANAKIHLPSGTVNGLSSIQAGYLNYFTRMPNATQTIDETICSNDKLVVRWTISGSPQSITQTITLTGINVYHITNGKISEEWGSTDFMSIVKQLNYTLQPPTGG